MTQSWWRIYARVRTLLPAPWIEFAATCAGKMLLLPPKEEERGMTRDEQATGYAKADSELAAAVGGLCPRETITLRAPKFTVARSSIIFRERQPLKGKLRRAFRRFFKGGNGVRLPWDIEGSDVSDYVTIELSNPLGLHVCVCGRAANLGNQASKNE